MMGAIAPRRLARKQVTHADKVTLVSEDYFDPAFIGAVALQQVLERCVNAVRWLKSVIDWNQA